VRRRGVAKRELQWNGHDHRGLRRRGPQADGVPRAGVALKARSAPAVLRTSRIFVQHRIGDRRICHHGQRCCAASVGGARIDEDAERGADAGGPHLNQHKVLRVLLGSAPRAAGAGRLVQCARQQARSSGPMRSFGLASVLNQLLKPQPGLSVSPDEASPNDALTGRQGYEERE
jgi:hypothetical protein